MATELRYFGIIKATIDHDARRITLTLWRRPVPAGYTSPRARGKLLAWALAALAPYQAQGYTLDSGDVER